MLRNTGPFRYLYSGHWSVPGAIYLNWPHYLVGQEQAGHWLPTGQCELAVQILFPSLAVAESSGIGDVKHDDTGRSISVVESGHGCETLLPWGEERALKKVVLRVSTPHTEHPSFTGGRTSACTQYVCKGPFPSLLTVSIPLRDY